MKKKNEGIWKGILGVGLARCTLAILQSFLNKRQINIVIFLSVLGLAIYLIVPAILKKEYGKAIKGLLLMIPTILGAIGLLLQKMFVAILGVVLLIIVIIIFMINNIRFE